MALGFRKKKGGSEDPVEESTQQEQSAPAAARQRKRKPNERLASVVKESAPGAAVDLLQRNEAFALPNRAGWMVLLLNVEAPGFGGLSLKHKGDEAKGSIIELITADHIEVVATAEMLEEDVLGIVPTAKTLERMGEYSLLTAAPYIWGVMSQTESGTLLANPVSDGTYAQALAVQQPDNDLTVASMLPEVWNWAVDLGQGDQPTEEVAAVPGLADDTVAVPIQDEQSFDDESEQPFGAGQDEAEVAAAEQEWVEPTPEDQGEPIQEYTDPDDIDAVDYGALDSSEEPVEDFDYDAEVQDVDGEDPDAFAGMEDEEAVQDEADEGGDYTEYVAQNFEREVAHSEIRDSIVRRLSSEDLDLLVDVEEFDRVFSTETPAVTIEIGHADAWLADQVSDYVRQANSQIEKMHADHVEQLRRDYVSLMSLHSEKIMREFSTTRPGTQYFDLTRAAKEDFEADMRQGTEEISGEQKQISLRFETEADEQARAAAESARARFYAQNRSMRERLLSEAGINVEKRIEDRYAAKRKTLLEMRRSDAQLAMELGSTKAMQLLSERQERQHQEQTALLRQWNDRITSFIDENRKDDVARTQTLAEKLARDTQVQELTDQFARERRELQDQQAQRVRELEGEMISNRERAAAELRERESEWKYALEVEREKVGNGNALVSKLEEQMGAMDRHYKEQYESRIETLVSDKESYGAELDRANHIQSRANKILMVLVIVLALAAFAVGIIVGWGWFNAGTASAMILPIWDGVGVLPGGATP